MAEFTWFSRSAFVAESHIDYPHGATPRIALEDLIQKHQQRIGIIRAILETDAPEKADAKVKAEIAEAHPQGVHSKCNCTHTAKIQQPVLRKSFW